MCSVSVLARRIGAMVRKRANKKGCCAWFNSHMIAASRAIAERIPLVDFVLEIRDARIPLSSAFDYENYALSGVYHMIILNKADLADQHQTRKWMEYFQSQGCMCYAVNSHNRDSMKVLLNALQAKVRETMKGQLNCTTTVLLVGIPNAGKSSFINSFHQIGRINAVEKGKLKHALVSTFPGETKDIVSYKIASHPNIYVLDTPGILPAQLDDMVAAKLMLTGAVHDSLVEEVDLARYCLAILNKSTEYEKWEKLALNEQASYVAEKGHLESDGLHKPRKKQLITDHSQDFIVREVRQILFQIISSFNDAREEKGMAEFIETELCSLHHAFRVPSDSYEDGSGLVAKKLLNLWRTGRLGHYSLDFDHL